MYTDSTTTKMLSKVKSCLETSLKKKYNKDDDDLTNSILKIHGLEKSKFDVIKRTEQIINEKLNDTSIDSNSNKSEKTIESINQECAYVFKKTIGYDYLYRQMKEIYGKEEANVLMGDMLDFSLGLADSTNILKPYCYSLDASKIVTEGRQFGQLYSMPSKRVSSYISALCETIHQLSSHLAGAIAIGSFFLDIAHLCLYREKLDLRDLKTSKKTRKHLENEMQQFLHSVNHLSRSGIESPFSNISVFDRIKLAGFVREMKWYFPFDKLPIDVPKDLETDEEKEKFFVEYIVDFIMEIQTIFIEFFDQGDPSKDGLPYRFPVVTINLSKHLWGEKQLIQDDKFLRYICKKDIYRYNIFVSEGSKIASCCRLISNEEMIKEFAAAANSFGGSGISLGSHRVCTINFMRLALETKTEEEFWKLYDERITSAVKILKAHKDLIKMLESKGLQPFISNGWLSLRRMFSTVGILGIYECEKLYKEKYNCPKTDITKKLLIMLNEKCQVLSKEYDLMINQEQIPAESFAIRLAKVDKMVFGDKKVPYILYANQFVPLWEDYTIYEKMDADGKYNSLLTGGGIVHATIGEKVTASQAEKLIKYSVASGCEHFALNSIYSICEDGHCSFGKAEVCPKCEKKIVDYLTRVVGFFTPVNQSWEKERREWEFDRRKIIKL